MLGKDIKKTARELRDLEDVISQGYGYNEGYLGAIFLYQAYIKAKYTNDTSNKVVKWFESKGWPPSCHLALYEVYKGVPLLRALRVFRSYVKSLRWSLGKMPLFDRAVVASKHHYPVEVLVYGEGGFVSVYDQCCNIHRQMCQEKSWMIKGNNIIDNMKSQIKNQVLGCWDQEGLFVLQGVDLLLNNTCISELDSATTKFVGKRRLIEVIDSAAPSKSIVVDALAHYIPPSVCSLEKQMMYLAQDALCMK